MKTLFLFLLFIFSRAVFAQKSKDSLRYKQKYYQRVSVEFSNAEWFYQGLINDFSTLEKGQITAEFGISTIYYPQINVGLTNNIELKTGLLSDSDGTPFVNPFVGIKVKKAVMPHFLMGVDAQIAYDKEKDYYAPTIAVGGQFQKKRVNVGASIFVKLGRNKVYDDIMLNSVNFWGLFHVWRRGNVGLVYIKTINPGFYSRPIKWPEYLAPTCLLYYEFLFKRSKLNLGVQYKYNKVAYLYPETQYDFFPYLRYNFLIKK